MAKTLIELMVEVGVQWPEGAEYATQDEYDRELCFYREKPTLGKGNTIWSTTGSDVLIGIVGKRLRLTELASDWHQTIITRDQYQIAAAKPKESIMQCDDIRANRDIVTIPEGWYGGSVQPATIEQRIDQLRAMEKQVAEMRQALTKDLEALGLTWLESKPVSQGQEPLNITDWRDLRDGDIIEITDCTNSSWKRLEGKELHVSIIPDGETVNDIYFGAWCMSDNTQWRFIRRPS